MTDTGTLDRDGFRLQWVREGSGVPMLIVGGQEFYRRYFPPALRNDFEIVFGDSRQWVPTPSGFDLTTLSIQTFADDIEAIRQTAALDRPLVVGQSQHGAIALEYARLYPESVRGVVAVAPNPPIDSGDWQQAGKDFFRRDADAERLEAHERNRATRRVPEKIRTFKDFVDEYISNDAMNWYQHSFDSSPLWDGVEGNLKVMYQLFAPQGLGGFELQPFAVPAFLALGRYDYRIPYYLWEEPKKRLLYHRYRLYDKSGHHPPYEQPEQFTADVVDWAKQL